MKWCIFAGMFFVWIACDSTAAHKNNRAKNNAIPVTSISRDNISSDPAQFPYDVSVKDIYQQSKKSSDILKKGDHPTVILFWLTTCIPCAKELRAMNAHFAQWQKQVPFHLVAMSEDKEENFNAIIDRVSSEHWPFETYWDFNRNFGGLMPGRLNGLPQAFIFDKQGKLTWSKKGYLPGDESAFFEKIKEAARS